MNNWNIGVLNDTQLNEIIDKEFILNYPYPYEGDRKREGINGSSIDLHLSDQAWELTAASKLPKDYTVERLIKEQSKREFSVSQEKLEKERIYIIKLVEELAFNNFPRRNGLYGVASGRSTIGRLDILTRLLVDKSARYDEVHPAYKGPMYLEVVPLSFDIILKRGISLNQLRVFHGRPSLSEFSRRELSDCAPMLYDIDGLPSVSDPELLCLNLKPDPQRKEKIVTFSALSSEPLDCTPCVGRFF